MRLATISTFLFCIFCAVSLSWSTPLEIDRLDAPVPLDGVWLYQTGDDLAWAEPDFNDESWTELQVPLDWGLQGFNGYSGIAWYRKTIRFDITDPLVNAQINSLSLKMGRIHSAYELLFHHCLGGGHHYLGNGQSLAG